MKNKMDGFSSLTADDMYHDYGFEFDENLYCEETGRTYKIKGNRGWDDYEELYEEEFGLLDEEDM